MPLLRTEWSLHLNAVIIRLEARLQPNIGSTSRRSLAVFTRSAIIPPKWTDLDEIWSTLGYIVWGWLWQTLGAIRAVAIAGERGNIFVSGKQRTISTISRRPNFTKFEHDTSSGVAMKTFGAEFWKFYRKGCFFQKAKISQMFNVLRLQAAITPQWLQIAGKIHYQNYPLRDF